MQVLVVESQSVPSLVPKYRFNRSGSKMPRGPPAGVITTPGVTRTVLASCFRSRLPNPFDEGQERSGSLCRGFTDRPIFGDVRHTVGPPSGELTWKFHRCERGLEGPVPISPRISGRSGRGGKSQFLGLRVSPVLERFPISAPRRDSVVLPRPSSLVQRPEGRQVGRRGVRERRTDNKRSEKGNPDDGRGEGVSKDRPG